MIFKSINDVLIYHQDYIVEELLIRFKSRPWSPYQEFMLKNDYFIDRAKIFFKFFIEALNGNSENLMSDQQQSTYLRATKGFHLTNTWSPHRLYLEIFFELFEKLENEGRLVFQNVYGELYKVESLLISLYEVFALTYIRAREDIINEKSNQIDSLQHFTECATSMTNVDEICREFLTTISKLIDVREFVILLYEANNLVECYTLNDRFNVKHLQSSIMEATEKNQELFIGKNGSIAKENLQYFKIFSAIIPVIRQRNQRLNGVLILHNHETGFSLIAEEISLLHQFLKVLFLSIQSIIHFSELKKGDKEVSDLKSKFTPRELEMLKFLAKGMSDQEIADSLFISKHTVRTHIKNLFKKLEVTSRSQVIVKSIESHLL